MFLTSQPQNLNPTGDFKKPMKQAGSENACIIKKEQSLAQNPGNIIQSLEMFMGQRFKNVISCRGLASKYET